MAYDDDFEKHFGKSKDEIDKVDLEDWDGNGVNKKKQQERQAVEESIRESEASKLDREIADKLRVIKIMLHARSFDKAAAMIGDVEKMEEQRAESGGYCDNPEVYWCKVLLKNRARDEADLISKKPDLENDDDFSLAVDFCKTEEQKQRYLSLAEKIKGSEAEVDEPEEPRAKPAKIAETGDGDAVKKKLRRVSRLIDAGDFEEAEERLEKIEQDEIDRDDDCVIPQVYHYKMLLDYKARTDDELIATLIEKQEDITQNKNYRLAKSCAEDADGDDEFDALLAIKKKAADGIAKAKAEAEAKAKAEAEARARAEAERRRREEEERKKREEEERQRKAEAEARARAEAEEERLRKIASLTQQADEAYQNKKYKNAIELYNQAVQLGANNLQSKVEQAEKDEEARKALNSLWDYKDLGDGYVNFGAYPQSKKTSSVQIGQVYDSERGYYLGSDNYLYEKLNNEYYKVEPIKWKVLSRGSELFIVSDMIIDRQIFHESSNNYANSEIRSWLNNDFYNKAFREEQKSKIVTTNVDNSLASTGDSSNQYVCGNTRDKVFLLSHKETAQYFTSNSARQRRGTDYAKARGLCDGYSWWWLRSPYYNSSNDAQRVDYRGWFSWRGVDISGNGALPALKFKP